MSVIGSSTLAGASGSAGGDKVYVDDVFSTFLYDGNEGSNQINNGIDLAGEGGLVWFKNRTRSGDAPTLIDTETQSGGYLISNGTAAIAGPQPFSSFNSNGYTINSGYFYVNDSSHRYASWTFRKAPGFFDVVTYTGNDVVGRQIAHNLGSVPGMIIVKAYSNSSESWHVYHRSLGNTKYLLLNSTNAENTGVTVWNSTTPTSTHFTVANNNGTNGFYNYVAYIFAHDDAQYGTDSDESIIKCGSYTGNGNTEGPTIDLGFEPQFVLIKRSSNSGGWYLFDSMRGIFSGINDPTVQAQETNAEAVSGNADIALTPTGFQATGSGVHSNASGNTYIYMAIRRPNKPPEAATDVFAIDTGNSSSTIPAFDSGFPVDFAFRLSAYASGGNNPRTHSRLQGPKELYTSLSNAEASDSATVFDSMTGMSTGFNSNDIAWMFKRAPGFMDVVSYKGAGGNTSNSQNHNLGVQPEMIIVKNRDVASGWPVYHSAVGLSRSARLHDNGMDENASGYWESAPTSTQFFPYGTDTNNGGYSWIAYLFATLPGISFVGSYSGTGNDINVDCGFTSGARFVLIKRTDSSGGWWLFDSTRGIVSGNDPGLEINTSNAQNTTIDCIDPLSSGFTVASTALTEINTSGGTYIFLAIA